MVTRVKSTKQLHTANGVGNRLNGAALKLPSPEDNPFRYGWRTVTETLADGTVTTHDVPLTQADFLDPQWGDHFVQSDPHLVLVVSLYNRFKKHYRQDTTTGVFCDLKMEWGIPGLKEPAPDLIVVLGLKDKEAQRSTFNVQVEGVRPTLIAEVVSPLYPGDDTDKVAIYEQAGVAEYIVINPHFNRPTARITLQGWRLVNGRYVRMRADGQGRLLSRTTAVWFALSADKRHLLLYDAVTGEEILTEEQEEAARAVTESRAQEAEERLRQAETSAAAERAARLAAESHAAALAEELARLKALWVQQNPGSGTG